MSRRIGILAVALLVAMLGTAAVFSYVSRVEAQTLADAEPVDVLVAATRIPSGTTATGAAKGNMLELVAMPRKAVPEGALTSLDGLGTQSLLSDVFAGEVMLRAKFADQTARTGTLLIPKDRLAISVELGDPQRVAGFVLPGSEVAIFATVEKLSGTAEVNAAQGSVGAAKVNVSAEVDDNFTRVLLPRVSVIAVGPATLRPAAAGAEKDEEAIAKAVLTVALTQAEAEKLVHSVQTGKLYFGLLSPTSKTGPGVGVSNSSLFK